MKKYYLLNQPLSHTKDNTNSGGAFPVKQTDIAQSLAEPGVYLSPFLAYLDSTLEGITYVC